MTQKKIAFKHAKVQTVTLFVTMRSMCSMRGGFIFRNRGPSLKVHHCQHLASKYPVTVTVTEA
jgi:hypothetical protein